MEHPGNAGSRVVQVYLRIMKSLYAAFSECDEVIGKNPAYIQGIAVTYTIT